LKLIQAIRSKTAQTKKEACTAHTFCNHEIRLLDDAGIEESYPIIHQLLPGQKERMPAFIAKNWVQRNHILKQRLLMEGKVRPKEGEYEGATYLIPSADSLAQWIDQSKAYGASLSKERDRESSPTVRRTNQFAQQ